MLKKIILISLFLSFPALADRQDDIAEFNRLFIEYNKNMQNLTDIDKAIEIAEEIYKLTPRIYGKETEEYSIVTYNLASLYDQKGGNGKDETEKDLINRSELKASNLYKKYFRMQNLRKVPKDFDYLEKYFPYLDAYYNSHPHNAELDVSEKFLEIARNLELSETELANIELHVAITRAQGVDTPLGFQIVYGIENFENAIRLFESDEINNADQLAESHFWLARHDIGIKKYDLAENRLTKVVNYLENGSAETQMLKNEALQLLSLMKIKKEDVEAADFYYKQIITPEEHQGYLVPVNKPEAYKPFQNGLLQTLPAIVDVKYDVDMFGKTFNIEIPYLAYLERNWTFAITFEQYEKYVTDIVAAITYLPPHKNGEKIFVRNVSEKLIFRQNLAY